MPVTGVVPVLTFEFTSYIKANGDSLCTKNEIVVHEDGTWLLHISTLPYQQPIIDLAGHPTTPVSVVMATIKASFEAAVATAPPQAPDRPST